MNTELIISLNITADDNRGIDPPYTCQWKNPNVSAVSIVPGIAPVSIASVGNSVP